MSISTSLIIIILAFLTGLGKAVRDTITHHWERSIFTKIKSAFWFKWFRSDWKDRPRHQIWFLWDAWHFFDSLSYFVYLPMIIIADNYIQLIYIVFFRWLAFHEFYHDILISKKFKKTKKKNKKNEHH